MTKSKTSTKSKPSAAKKRAVQKPATPADEQGVKAAEAEKAPLSLPSAPRIFISSLQILGRHWKTFLGILAIYAVLMILFVRGLQGGIAVDEIKAALEEAGSGGLSAGMALFMYLMGNANTTNSDAAGVYQFVLALIISLAVVWNLRQMYAGAAVRIRDGFYKGMYPLVPFLLVLGVIVLQLVPFGIGAFLFGTVQTNAVTVTGASMLLWGTVFFGLSLLSLYMVAASVFALYIVCLPDMQPMAALRSARQLVRQRRWTVLRKLLFLPLALLVLAAVVMMPLIMVVPALAGWVFFGLGMAGLFITHSYLYRLYRELL